MEKELGIIESTKLGLNDHDGMVFWLYFDFGGHGQGFGGQALDYFNKETKQRDSSAFGILSIRRILEVAQVEDWENLVGKSLWAYKDHDRIYGIETKEGGKFMIQDLIDECRRSEKTQTPTPKVKTDE